MTIVLEDWHPSPEVLRLLSLARDFAEREHPVTVRQTFYHLVSIGVTPNAERSYGRLVKILIKARKAGILPFEWFIDLTRRPLELSLYEDVSAFLTKEVDYYFRDTWIGQPVYLIVWVEKQALQGVLWPVAAEYNVSLFVGRGYASWPITFQAVERFRRFSDKDWVLLYLGDYDPSGTDISRDLESRFHRLGVEIEFDRLALTREQVDEHKLPPMPAKKQDPRYKSFIQKHGESSVELDALPPSVLRTLLKEKIETYLDMDAFRRDLAIEKSEKQWLLENIEELKEEM